MHTHRALKSLKRKRVKDHILQISGGLLSGEHLRIDMHYSFMHLNVSEGVLWELFRQENM